MTAALLGLRALEASSTGWSSSLTSDTTVSFRISSISLDRRVRISMGYNFWIGHWRYRTLPCVLTARTRAPRAMSSLLFINLSTFANLHFPLGTFPSSTRTIFLLLKVLFASPSLYAWCSRKSVRYSSSHLFQKCDFLRVRNHIRLLSSTNSSSTTPSSGNGGNVDIWWPYKKGEGVSISAWTSS